MRICPRPHAHDPRPRFGQPRAPPKGPHHCNGHRLARAEAGPTPPGTGQGSGVYIHEIHILARATCTESEQIKPRQLGIYKTRVAPPAGEMATSRKSASPAKVPRGSKRHCKLAPVLRKQSIVALHPAPRVRKASLSAFDRRRLSQANLQTYHAELIPPHPSSICLPIAKEAQP